MKCIDCGARSTRDYTYEPPDGYSPDLLRFICDNEKCACVFYVERRIHVTPETQDLFNPDGIVPKLPDDDSQT